MRLATPLQVKRIDQLAVERYELSDESLMEAAGALAAAVIRDRYFIELRKRVVILCGPGGNGGDGLVVARHLKSMGASHVEVLLTSEKMNQLTALQKQRLKGQGVKICTEACEASSVISSASLVIDALFGIGLNKEISGLSAELIHHANSAKAKVVSLDVASGLDALRGVPLGASAIKADATISFGFLKPGHLVQEGPKHSGLLISLPMGYPKELLRLEAKTHFVFSERLARRYLPTRSDLGNKSKYGHLLLAAGKAGTLGAATLSAMAASRIGAGYVTYCSEDSSEILKLHPEALTQSLRDFDFASLNKYSAVAVGPGFGRGPNQRRWLKCLRDQTLSHVVLDADALDLCKEEGLFPLPPHWLITPHAGELSRLIGLSAKEIEADRFSAGAKATETLGCRVLLKGFRTVIASPGRAYVVPTGNGALAKAGTGDVLTGFIGGLMAQGRNPLVAAGLGAYLHGRLADDWVSTGRAQASLGPMDLTQRLPDLIGQLGGAGW